MKINYFKNLYNEYIKPVDNFSEVDYDFFTKSQKIDIENKELKMIKSYMYSRRQRHKWHVVSYSPWPICTAMSAFITLWGFLCYLHYIDSGFIFLYGLFFFCLCLFGWFRDVITESVYMGYHTIPVQENLRFGFVLFIVSEIMFFSSFFWAYFHCSLSPSIHIGCMWPPEGIVHFFISSEFFLEYKYTSYDLYAANKKFVKGFHSICTKYPEGNPIMVVILNFSAVAGTHYIVFDEAASATEPFYVAPRYKWLDYLTDQVYNVRFYFNLYDHGVLMNPYKIPFLNTVILLTSGCILTTSHMFLRIEGFFQAILSLIGTIILAFYFIFCQYYEYKYACFSINDGIYGSTFFMLTGFHGFHVIVGTIFLSVCLGRFLVNHYTRTDHLSFECAIWYWHFVDVVWIFLYLVIYLWPSTFFFKLYSMGGQYFDVFHNFNASWKFMNLWIKVISEPFGFYYQPDVLKCWHLHTQAYEGILPWPMNFNLILDNPELIKREFVYTYYTTSTMLSFVCLMDWYYIIATQWWDWNFTHQFWSGAWKLSTSMILRFDRILPYP